MKSAKRKVLKLDAVGEVVEDNREIVTSPDKDKSPLNYYSGLTLGTEIGLGMIIPLIGGIAFGVFLDKKLHTAPGFTLFLLFIGLFIGAFNIINIIRKYDK